MIAPLLEAAAIVVLIAVGFVLERLHGGVDLLYLSFVGLFAGSLASRFFAARRRVQSPPRLLLAFELTAFVAMLASPLSPLGYGLASVAALYLATFFRPEAAGTERRASWFEELLVLAIPIALVGLAIRSNPDPDRAVEALLPLGVLLLEAYGPRAPRTAADAVNRAAAFGIAGVAVAIAGEDGRRGVRVDDATLGLSTFLALGAALKIAGRIVANRSDVKDGLGTLARRIADFGDGAGRVAAYASLVLLGGALLFSSEIVLVRARRPLPPTRIAPEKGRAFGVWLEDLRPETPGDSTIEVLEDERPLGPEHVMPDTVRAVGAGAFSDRLSPILLFSTSDGSDPRSNGRRYTLVHDWHPSRWVIAALLAVAIFCNARRAFRLHERIETLPAGVFVVPLVAIGVAFRLALARHQLPDLVMGHLVKEMPFSDGRAWYLMASDFSQNVRWHDPWVYWDARRPFYYMFQGSVFALVGPSVSAAQVTNLVLSSIGTVLVFDAVQRVASRPVACVAALVQAMSVLGARMDLSTMTESLGAFLSDAALWAFVVGATEASGPSARMARAALAFVVSGITLALSNLARPLTMAAVAGLPLALAFVARRCAVPRRRVVLAAVLLGASCAATVAPWILRQHAKYGIWTISDNTAEALYGATNPEYGEWTTAVGDLAGDRSLSERVKFFSEGTSRNLREHGWWYVLHVLDQILDVVDQTTVPAWIYGALGAWFMAVALGSPSRLDSPGEKRALVAAVVLIGAAAVKAVVLYAVGLLALPFVVLARRPMTLVASMQLAALAALGMVALAGDPRFSYPLIWQRAAFVGELVLAALAFLDARHVKPGVWPRRDSWGRPGRWLLFAAALLVAFVVAGAARALTRTPPAPPPAPVVPPEPWLEQVLAGEGAVLRPLASRLCVRRAQLRPGFAARFAAGETNRHWSALFDPRPYDFTVFELEPMPPEAYAVFPGRLPEETRGDLLFVGVHVDKPEWGNSLEVVAIGVVGADGAVARFVRPEPTVAREHARTIAAVISASSPR